MATLSHMASGVDVSAADDDMEISSNVGRFDDDFDIDIDITAEHAGNQDEDYVLEDADSGNGPDQGTLDDTNQDDVMQDDEIRYEVNDRLMQEDGRAPDKDLSDLDDAEDDTEEPMLENIQVRSAHEINQPEKTTLLEADEVHEIENSEESKGTNDDVTVAQAGDDAEQTQHNIPDQTELQAQLDLQQEQKSQIASEKVPSPTDEAAVIIVSSKFSTDDPSGGMKEFQAEDAKKEAARPGEEQNNSHVSPQVKAQKDHERLQAASSKEANNGNEASGEEASNEYYDTIHPCIVTYHDEEISLFPPRQGNNSESFFLQDELLVHQSIGDLLRACRTVLGETLDPRHELELDVPELGLCISEDSAHAFTTSFSQILDVYVHLHHLDGIENPDPLYIKLSTKMRFSARLAQLGEAVASGKGLLQLQDQNSSDQKGLVDTGRPQHEIGEAQNSAGDRDQEKKDNIGLKETSKNDLVQVEATDNKHDQITTETSTGNQAQHPNVTDNFDEYAEQPQHQSENQAAREDQQDHAHESHFEDAITAEAQDGEFEPVRAEDLLETENSTHAHTESAGHNNQSGEGGQDENGPTIDVIASQDVANEAGEPANEKEQINIEPEIIEDITDSHEQFEEPVKEDHTKSQAISSESSTIQGDMAQSLLNSSILQGNDEIEDDYDSEVRSNVDGDVDESRNVHGDEEDQIEVNFEEQEEQESLSNADDAEANGSNERPGEGEVNEPDDADGDQHTTNLQTDEFAPSTQNAHSSEGDQQEQYGELVFEIEEEEGHSLDTADVMQRLPDDAHVDKAVASFEELIEPEQAFNEAVEIEVAEPDAPELNLAVEIQDNGEDISDFEQVDYDALEDTIVEPVSTGQENAATSSVSRKRSLDDFDERLTDDEADHETKRARPG